MESEGPRERAEFFRLRPYDSYGGEIVVLSVVACIALVALLGRYKNKKAANRVANAILSSDGAARANFAFVSTKLRQIGPDIFKLYMSGRRYCSGAEITLKMCRRQDFLALVMGAAQSDFLEIEIAMDPSTMPSTVFLISEPSTTQSVLQQHPEIADLAKFLTPPKDRLSQWPRNDLEVHSEHSSVFYDIFSVVVASDTVLNSKNFNDARPYFRYLLATSDYNVQGRKLQVIKACIQIPPRTDDLQIIQKLIHTVGIVIDGIANIRLTPEQSKRSLDARNARKDSALGAEERTKRAEERKTAKEAEEKARLARMTPEQRAKEKARREKIQRDRKLRNLMKKA